MTTSIAKDDVSTGDVCSWKEPKDELLSKIVGEDGYEIGEGPGEGFGMQQKLVLAAVFVGGAAYYYYKNHYVPAAGEGEL